jgi:outer membrane protein assembly complex protein YaeT
MALIRSQAARRTAVAFAGLLLLLTVAYWLLHTEWAKKAALTRLREGLRAQNIVLEGGRLEYDLFGLSASLRDIKLRSLQEPNLPPIAVLETASVSLNWTALTSLSLDIDSATLAGANLHVVIEKDGRTNVPQSPEAADSSEPREWLVRKLVAEDASLLVEDRQHDVSVALKPWTLTMTGSPSTRQHELALTTSQPGEVIYQGRRLPVTSLAANATLEKDALRIARALLSSGESRVELSGRLDHFGKPLFDVAAKSTLEVAPLALFAGRTERLGGRVELSATAKGEVETLKVSGTVTGRELAYQEFSGVNLTANAVYDGATKRAQVVDSAVESPYGTVRATADMALEAGESKATARVDGVDVERLARMAKSTMVPATRASLTVNAQWPALQFEKATGNGTLQAVATQADAAPDRLPVSADVVFSGRLDQVRAEIRSLTAVGVEASGTVHLANQRNLSGTFAMGSDRLAEVLRQTNLLLAKSTVIEGFDGRAAIDATLGGTIDAPSVDAAVAVEDLQANRVSGATLESGVTYANNLVSVSGLALRWQGQALLADGTVDLQSRALEATARTENVKIETLLASLGEDAVATGALQAEVHASGTIDQPVASVAVAGTALTAYAEPLGTLRAQATLSNNVLNVSELRFPEKGLRATGSYQLDTGTYKLDAQAPSLQLTGLQLPDGKTVTGTFAISATGAGTAANPQLEATVAGAAVTLDGMDHGAVTLTAAVRDHAANVELGAPKYALTGTARIGTDAPYAATFAVKADGTAFANLPLPAGLPLAGAVRGTVAGAGELSRWQQGTARLSLEPVDVKWNSEVVTTQGPIEAEYANEVLEVRQAQVLAAGSNLSISGSLPLDPQSTQGLLRVNGEVDLAGAPKLVPDWEQPVGASGKLTLAGEVRGNLQRIEPIATVSLRDATITPAGLNPVSDLQLEARVADGTVTLDKFSGTWAKALVTASGEFPLSLLPAGLPVEFPRKAGPARLTLDAKGLDIAAIEGVPANTSGTVAFHVEAEAAKPEIAALEARATIEEMRVKFGDIVLEQTGQSAINVADGTARIESFTLAGPGTDLALRGRASLVGDYPLGVRLAGNIETGVLSTLMAPARMRGPARIQLSVYGPAKELKAAGFVELTDAQVMMQEPRIAADNVNARINLTGEQAAIEFFNGSINGGPLTVRGGLRFPDGEPQDIDLTLDAKSVYLDYPYGLRTLSDALVTVKQTGPQIVVGGNVTIQEGSFRELVTIEGNLLSMLNAPPADDLFAEERNKYLDRTRFNLGIKTETPLLVNNNLAKAGINMDARLAGTYYRPALLGRVTFEEGGELYFNERSYTVERGSVTFNNDQKIEPSFDILARTRVANHDVSLLISGGGAERMATTLTSDPPLPEDEIIAMLITGRPPEEFKNTDTATLASRQAASYFASSFGSRFTRQLERATGLSTVRVEPDLIANESNPTARLTVGQDLSKDVRLIYSMNLANGGDQIYVAEYDITKRFLTRGVKQVDNTYRFEFRHDMRFGGVPPPRSSYKDRENRVIGTVEMPSTTPIPEQKLRDKFKNKSGKRYDFFEVRKGLDRLEKLFRDQNLLEARVRVRREMKEKTVDLALDIEAGPSLSFVYEGWNPSRKSRKQVREIWQNGVFDAQRLDDATRALQTALIEDGFLEAKIEPKVTATDRKLVTFDVQPGVKYGKPTIEFPGAEGIKEGDLRDLLKRRELRAAPYLDSAKVRDLLQSYYRERGFLDAKIQLPQPVFEDGKATIRIPVVEGPRYQVASVKFEGNTALKPEQLVEKSELKADAAYELPLRQTSIDQIRDLYVAQGYHDAQVETSVARGEGKVDVTYKITEGPKEVVQAVEVSGNDATSEKLVRSQVALKAGEALEPIKLAESRRNLYSTGAYSLVDLERVPAGDVSAGGIKPMLLRAKVREVQPFELKYGAYFDTDRGPGAVVDFANRNSLGSARAIGGRLRYDSDFREGRVYFSQPLLRRFPVQSIVSGFVNRSLLPTFLTDRIGVSAQQETRFKRLYLVNYGYRMERVHTYEKVPDEFLPFDVRLVVAPLTFTMNRESRDDILDATRGSFISSAFEWAPEMLGSDVRFIRYYAQYFKYLALGKPVEIPMSGGLKKPRLVYAGAARMGLARGLGGQDLVLSERFFAGGGTTMRGFAQNTLGPSDFLGDPAGGNAVVLINNEIRFPMVSIFDGVGFVDVGNVYSRVSDISFRDLRKVAGAGLRIRTPYFLIRFDYGFKLDRKPGESIGGFFFSIGQAF